MPKKATRLLALFLAFSMIQPVNARASENLASPIALPALTVEPQYASSFETDVPVPSGNLRLDHAALSAMDENETTVTTLNQPPAVIYTRGYNLDHRQTLPGYGTVIPRDANHFSYRYDVGAGWGASVDVVMDFGDTSSRLSSDFQVGLRRMNALAEHPGLERITILFEDTRGVKHTWWITGLTETEQIFSLDLSQTYVDFAHIKKITFSQNYWDIGIDRIAEERRGEIFVRLNGLGNDMPLQGEELVTAAEDVAIPLMVSPRAFIRGEGTVPGFITLLEPREDTYGFRYDVGGSKGSAVRAEIYSEDIFKIKEKVKIALRHNGNGTDVRIRLIDGQGLSAIYRLQLSENFQIFELDLTDPLQAAPAFNSQKIQHMEIEVDRTLSPERRGQIEWKFIDFGFETTTFADEQPVILEANPYEQGGFFTRFTPVEKAVIYQVQVAKDADFQEIVHEGFPPSSEESVFDYFNVEQPGTYYLRVRASLSPKIEDGALSQWSEIFPFDVHAVIFWEDYAQQHPVIDSVISVQGYAEINVSFEQDISDRTLLYHYQVASDPEFKHIMHESFPPDVRGFTGGFDDGAYYVRVRGSSSAAFLRGLTSGWSPAYKFYLESNFGVDGPLYTVTADPDRQLAIHIEPVEDLNSYQIEIFADPAYTQILHRSEINGNTLYVDGSSHKGDYFVRVRGSASTVFNEGPHTTFSYFWVEDPVPVVYTLTPEDDLFPWDLDRFGLPEETVFWPTTVYPQGSRAQETITDEGLRFHYTTGEAGWAGAGFAFDDFMTDEIETADFTGVDEFLFGLDLGELNRIKVEFVDADDHKHAVYLDIEHSAEEDLFFRLPLSGLRYVDLSRIRLIYFIVEGINYFGEVEIFVNPADQPFRPTPGLTPADLNGLPLQTGETIYTTSFTAQGENGGSIAQPSERGMIFNIPANVGVAAAGFTYDDFGDERVQSSDWSSVEEIRLGLQGEPRTVVLEFVDANDQKVRVLLDGIEPDRESVFVIPVDVFAGLDLQHMRILYFLIEDYPLTGELLIHYNPPLSSL